MRTAKLHASAIISAFYQAQYELVGKAVVLTDGKAGTVESVRLDEFHGLRISIWGHYGKWPISTVKFAENDRRPDIKNHVRSGDRSCDDGSTSSAPTPRNSARCPYLEDASTSHGRSTKESSGCK